MERTDIALGLGALALVISVGVAVQVTTQNNGSVDSLNESEVTDIAEGLDSEQSSRYGEPLYAGSSMGYVIDFPNGESFYVSGDTGPMWTLENYVKDSLDPSVSFFSTGNVYTADMETGAEMASQVDSEVSIPIHYGTFPFLDQDTDEFENRLSELRSQGETSSESRTLETGEWETIRGVETMWVGHGTMFFKGPEGTDIMVDPWIKTNPKAPESWKNDSSNIPETDMILITHGHLDHFTPSMIETLQEQHNSTVVAEWELAGHMANQGFSNTVAVNKGADLDKSTLKGAGATGAIERVSDDINLHTVWAKHSSSPATSLGDAFGIAVEGEITE
ncbi:hypothetical protein AQV86_05980 [Nanohaloarchaea archaeon SG9]|nr:hypothetical protein AQV86_05980 [Nanohaloarchaea archaeon SG9]